MTDPRMKRIADNIADYSLRLKKGDKVLIKSAIEAKPLIVALVRKAAEIGALAYVLIYDEEINRVLALSAGAERVQPEVEWTMKMMEQMNAYVVIDVEQNDAEHAGVPAERMGEISIARRPIFEYVDMHMPWTLIGWPTRAQAQKAGMSFEDFSDFVFEVSSVDYAKMNENMKPLKALMERTDKVHIKGPGTDLTFSIKGIPALPCAGECNIPDGEIYTAPVRDSVNGTLTYNTPTAYHGKVYNNIRFEFLNGKIISASADGKSQELNRLLDTDEGSRYIGEFALGVNPMVKRPFINTLYDEKIDGSFHFTPGSAYESTADNGNRSAIHWDIVCIQTPEYGGGEIYFDGVLVRKDGKFVLPELLALNG